MSCAGLCFIALGLSMDAFAVAVLKGMARPRPSWREAAAVGAYFGFFQAMMPGLGYLLGSSLYGFIEVYDHWIAWGLLSLIGAGMIRESLCSREEEPDPSLSVCTMLLLATATSIDAMAAGVTFAFLSVPLLPEMALIGATTFLLSAAGVKAGAVFGGPLRSRAGFFGGVILMLMGVKILMEHLTAI